MLSTLGYEYKSIIGGSESSTNRIIQNENIVLQRQTEKGENRIAVEVSDFIRSQFLHPSLNERIFKEIEDISMPYQIENLMMGSMNLINEVINRHNFGNPVETMLFLDKSARNGAYVFRCMWRELQSCGEIPGGVELPEIRFMNIGLGEDEKHGAKAPEYYLRKKYRSEDFEDKKVLVIDEYVSSGGSLRRAMKSLQDIYGLKPDGIANFTGLPEWYGSTGSGVMGVTDFEYNSEFNAVKRKMQRIDLFTASSIWEVYKALDKGSFESIIEKIRFATSTGKSNEERLVDQVLKLLNTDIDRGDIEKIVEFVSDNDLSANDGKHVWQFVDSAGGFTSRKIEDDELNANGRMYRQVLKSIVSIYMFERQMENSKS